MPPTLWPIIANCNYESAEDRTIHEIRQALDRGLTDDDELSEAMDALEAALIEELHDSGEYRRGVLSEEAINAAEQAVLDAWTDDIQDAARAEQERRWDSG